MRWILVFALFLNGVASLCLGYQEPDRAAEDIVRDAEANFRQVTKQFGEADLRWAQAVARRSALEQKLKQKPPAAEPNDRETIHQAFLLASRGQFHFLSMTRAEGEPGNVFREKPTAFPNFVLYPMMDRLIHRLEEGERAEPPLLLLEDLNQTRINFNLGPEGQWKAFASILWEDPTKFIAAAKEDYHGFSVGTLTSLDNEIRRYYPKAYAAAVRNTIAKLDQAIPQIEKCMTLKAPLIAQLPRVATMVATHENFFQNPKVPPATLDALKKNSVLLRGYLDCLERVPALVPADYN